MNLTAGEPYFQSAFAGFHLANIANSGWRIIRN